MSEQKRLFIAINIPDELKEKISQTFLQKIKNQELSIVKKQNLHITLKFLSYLDEKNTQEVKEKMQKIEFEEFKAPLKEIGEFNARVLWIGAHDTGEQMQKIVQQLNELLQTTDEKFHPHITLARNKHMSKIEFKKLVTELNELNFSESFLVKSIDLMESKISDSGAEYFKIFEKTQK